MFENDATPNVADPVGDALRGLVLAVTSEAVAAGGRLAAREPRSRRRLRVSAPALSIAGAAAAAAALVVIVLGASGPHGPSLAPVQPRLASQATTVDGVKFVSYNLNQLVNQAPALRVRGATMKYPDLGANYDAIAFGAGSTWVLESTQPLGGAAKPIGRPNPSACGALLRVNSSTLSATGTLSLKRCPLALAFGHGSVWVLATQVNTSGYQLTRVDPATMKVQASTVVDGGPNGVTPQGDTGSKYLLVTAAGRYVTVAVQTARGASQLVTVNGRTLAPVGSATIPHGRGEATALIANEHGIWVGTSNGWLDHLKSRGGMISGERRLGLRILSLSSSRGAVWMTVALPSGQPDTAYPGFDMLQLNAATGAIEHDTKLPLLLVASDRTDLWGILAAPQRGNYVAKIDPATRALTGIAASPFKGPAFTPSTIGVNGGAAWIINTNLQTLTKIVLVR
jgi:hypothetical protein